MKSYFEDIKNEFGIIITPQRNYEFCDDIWRYIKEFLGLHGNIKCHCNHYLHTSKNFDGFLMIDHNTDKQIWCCKKAYESIYKELYDNHFIWKDILNDRTKQKFDFRFNYFNKNKALILKYVQIKNEHKKYAKKKTKKIEKYILSKLTL